MKMSKPGVILFILTLVLTSCSSHIYDREKEESAAQQSIETQVQDIGPESEWAFNPSSADYVPISVDWLSAFKDPILLDLIEEGKANNRNLKIAAGNVERAWLLARQAGVGLRPTLDLALGGSRTGIGSTTTSDVSLSFQAAWEIDIWGRIQAGYDAAVTSAQAIEADYIYAQHSLSASIARGYLLAIEAAKQADLTRQNIQLLERILAIAEFKYKNGAVTIQDVALARSDLATANDNLANIEGSRRDALRALEVLIGRYPNAQIDLPTTLPVLPPAPSAGIPSEILERRPDLIAAERNVAAAFQLTAQARAARLPRLSLTGSLGGASNELSSILNPANTVWQATGNVLVPVFNSGSLQTEVEIATIEQEQVLNTYAQAALEAFSEVEQNLDQGQVLLTREQALTKASNEINKAYEIARLRYSEGESELIDVLTIQQRQASADSNLIAIRRALLDQRINLYLALGGKW